VNAILVIAESPTGEIRPWPTPADGRGRIAVFAAAEMFTYQQSDSMQGVGLRSRGAEQNLQFVRNVIHWLAA